MIKLMGGLMLALTGVVLAISIYRFEQKKLKVIDAFITLLFHIKGQIDCFCLPLCDIVENMPAGIEILRGRRVTADFESMLEDNKIYLDEESYRLLECFYLEFGSMYREEQLRRCDYYIEALGEQRKLLFADLPARAKIGGALCVCSAIGLLIILW